MGSVSRGIAVFGLCVLAPVACWADDAPVFSGPQPGEALSPLKVFMPYGSQRGEKLDFVEAAKGKPTLFVVITSANRPAASLTLALMHYTEMQSPDELFGCVVWLPEDRSDAEKFLIRTRGAFALSAPLGISLDGSEGPGTYGFNRNVNVTVLVANKNRVTANFPLVQPSLSDAPKILQEVVKQAGGTVPTQAEIEFLSLMSLPEKNLPFPWENAAHQTELRRRICTLLAAADDAQADAAAERIDAYVAEHPDIENQFQQAVRLLSPSRSNKYYHAVASTHAVRHVKKWLEKYGDKER